MRALTKARLWFRASSVLAVIVTWVLLVGAGACTRPEQARRIVLQSGYDSVQTGGYGWLDCSEDDVFATEFVAWRDGVRVTGTVCQGLFKGSTVRLD